MTTFETWCLVGLVFFMFTVACAHSLYRLTVNTLIVAEDVTDEVGGLEEAQEVEFVAAIEVRPCHVPEHSANQTHRGDTSGRVSPVPFSIGFERSCPV